jgi:AraC-like DNA-binding protein
VEAPELEMKRQTREQVKLKRFRMLQPGEVDHEVDPGQLIQSPIPHWNAPILALCEYLYDRYVRSEEGAWIPDRAFCDLPRWVFLEYLVRFHDVLLVGSNDPDLLRLEPIVLSQNVYLWNQPRYYAFATGTEAIYRAILDTRRLRELDCTINSTLRWRFPDVEGQARWGFYFGIDYRALPDAPWRSGTIYLYRRADFPPDYETVPFLTNRPILPLAKLTVNPWDWPLLDRVLGMNLAAQSERQRETFLGYPWATDAEIHPKQWQRPLVDETRAYLENSYADPVDLPQLGRRIGVSPFALLRMFRAQVGISPREYQTLLRITQAKRLLKGDLPIAQVAVETGFCDQTHLTRHFRRIVGLTPGHYLRVQESPIPPLPSARTIGSPLGR